MTEELHTYYCKDCFKKQEQIERLEQERDELKKTVENQKLEYEELQCDLSEVENACDCYQSENAKLKQENKELRQQLLEDKILDEEIESLSREDTYRSALEEIKNNFMCFRSCMIPFHVGDKDNLPHKMADAIQNYCESIINKINEGLSNDRN